MTKRLQKILAALPHCQVLADVGCDHGYIGLGALQTGVAQKVVFVDISAPSLQKARNNCPQPLLPQASFVCQNGLGKVFADCAVIAGMGGMEIISVLDGAEHLPEHLVLQPMRNQLELRQRLPQDYQIVSDEMFFDGKFYDLITAKKCKSNDILTQRQLLFGKDNLQNPSQDFVAYLQKLNKERQQILSNSSDVCLSQKYEEAARLLAEIMEGKK